MAKFIPGPIVADIRGHIGSIVFSHNRGGNFTRAKTTKVPVISPARAAFLTARTVVGTAWRTLMTDPQRRSWYDYGQRFPTSSTLWPQRPNMGFEAFAQVNWWFAWFGYPLLLDAPPDRNVTQPSILTLQFVAGSPPQILMTAAQPTATEYANFFMSPANPPGRLYSWQRHVRYAGTFNNGQAMPLDIAPSWVALWGAIPPNVRIGVQLHHWRWTNGALSQRLAASILTS